MLMKFAEDTMLPGIANTEESKAVRAEWPWGLEY